MSRVNSARAQGPMVATSCPGCLALGPRAPGVYERSRATRALVGRTVVSTRRPGRLRPVSEGPRCRLAPPGDSGPGRRARGVDQLSRVTRGL